MNTEDLAEEDLDSMLEECSTLYEAVSTLAGLEILETQLLNI